MESESVLCLNEAYRIMIGVSPDASTSERTRMIEVVLAWDVRKLEKDSLTHLLVAQQTLAYIGTQWHKDFPFAFDLVAARLFEVKPELGAGHVDLFVMRNLLRGGDKPIIRTER